jgi:hypothetical protein
MLDMDVALPTLPDINRHQELKMWLMVGYQTGSRNNLYSGMPGVLVTAAVSWTSSTRPKKM